MASTLFFLSCTFLVRATLTLLLCFALLTFFLFLSTLALLLLCALCRLFLFERGKASLLSTVLFLQALQQFLGLALVLLL